MPNLKTLERRISFLKKQIEKAEKKIIELQEQNIELIKEIKRLKVCPVCELRR